MQDSLDLAAITHIATATLQQGWQAEVQLYNPHLISDRDRNRVMRCQMRSNQGEKTSVIIKQIKNLADAQRGFTDWASLQFLSQFPAAHDIAPRFYAGSVEQGIFIMEDLGDSTSLENILMGDDKERVTTVLTALARQMARCHAVSIGYEAEFEKIAQQLPDSISGTRHSEAEQWLSGSQKIKIWCDALGYTPPVNLQNCLENVAYNYAHPGLLAFTHGDPAPTNNHINGQQIRLLDFEYGGFRNALYDITGWNVLCPLPRHLVQHMSNHFQDELGKTCKAVLADDFYHQQWALMCTYRALAMLTWISPAILKGNQSWVGDWSQREAILTALSRLQQSSEDVTSLDPVQEMTTQLLNRLRQRWTEYREDAMPQWPVFKGDQTKS